MAANTRDIRRRIKSIKNTAQITKAMQMVAAAKIRRAQQAALAGREYAAKLNEVLSDLKARSDAHQHPLLEVREVKNELVLVISTDKGLCGALNTNLLREVGKSAPDKTSYITSGRKGVQYLHRTKRTVVADFPLRDNFSVADAKAISKFMIEKFLSGEFDRISVFYTKFVNTLSQVPTQVTLLPVSAGKLEKAEEEKSRGLLTDYEYEPSPAAVLNVVLPQYVHFEVYQMLLDSRASEQSARMVAMKNATDNAKQLIKDLTLEYNKIRQAAITTQLLEISTAQMALG
ncbi:MAG TPA: ATP synthase F1 subunit gamma [Chthoniobacteraceae bacterium]|nr:ATP synthase F1 subunit gamma [Chthoniobacteraceae bacterium]